MQPYLISDNCYEQRFAIVMILDYLILPEYLDKIFLAFSEIVSDEYYVQMALAWAVSVCYVKFPEETYSFLETQILQETVWKKTVRKIMDSYRVSDSDKEKIRKLNSVYCSSRKD